MGNWIIAIQGVGPHGNGLSIDAEQRYRDFIEYMKAAGHTITHSSITYGGAYFDPKTIPRVKQDDARWQAAIDNARFMLEEYKKIPAGAFGAMNIATAIAKYDTGDRSLELLEALEAIE